MAKYRNKKNIVLKPTKFGDARDNPEWTGPRSTMPARQRSGQTYPGGRSLRRAFKRLNSSKGSSAGAGKAKVGQAGYTTPGAMRP